MENGMLVSLRSSVSEAEAEKDRSNDVPLKEMFEAAAKVIQSLPKDGPYQPSNFTKLRFYSLYKQVREGKCASPQPSFFNLVNRAKWEAWKGVDALERDEAMTQYIEELKKIVETMSLSGDVQEFLEAINPFYEFVGLQGNEMRHVQDSLDEWTSVSSFSGTRSDTLTPKKAWVGVDLAGEVGVVKKESLEDVYLQHGKGGVRRKRLASEVWMGAVEPPGAPVHRRSVASGMGTYLAEHMKAIVEGENGGRDEVLKVDVDVRSEAGRGEKGEELSNATLHARLSAENRHSGTESEKYYSGDSESEVESPTSDKLMPETPFSTSRNAEYLLSASESRKRSPPPFPISASPTTSMSSPKASVDHVLYNTVERLNRDMEHILARVRLLEAAHATNHPFHTPPLQEHRAGAPLDLSPAALALILTWPFLVSFIIHLLRRWLGRRRR